ncbi:MAG: hypothetical protein L0271_06355 [Gemmatimonadetes bacterium]|nr:hypothetical protein [Gemmatimonadota bacterium]
MTDSRPARRDEARLRGTDGVAPEVPRVENSGSGAGPASPIRDRQFNVSDIIALVQRRLKHYPASYLQTGAAARTCSVVSRAVHSPLRRP